MSKIEISLTIAIIFVTFIYLTSALKNNKSFRAFINAIEGDIKSTVKNVSQIITNPVFDQIVVKVIKELMLLVEEKNHLAEKVGNTVLSGIEKKGTVISKLTEVISGITGSFDSATDYVTNHQQQIETIIDDYVTFSNNMRQPDKTNEN